jgi:aminoglycoside phosphotransferase (APT) family kinase protein
MTTEKGPMIARGRTAEIFLWKDNQVLKLFLDWCPVHWAEHEARVTQAVHEAGLPAPAVEGIVDVDGRPGIIFERVEGPSMLGELTTKPWKLVQFARTLAELQAAMHSLEAPELPSQQGKLENDIRAAVALPAETKESVLEALAALPGGSVICHGDFHPGNIVMSARGPIVIDWITTTQGSSLADVARTSLLLRQGEVPSFIAGRWLINSGRALFRSIYLKRYLRLRPGSPQQIAAWQLPVAAARLAENIPEEEPRLLALVEESLRRISS